MRKRMRFVALLLGVFACSFFCEVEVRAQEELREVFKDRFGLSFLVISPAASFGVGTIVKGRGKNLVIYCWPSECLPNQASLIERGVIKRERFGLELETVRTTKGLLNMLGLGFLHRKAKYIRLEFKNPIMQEISIDAAEDMYWDHLTDRARGHLRKGRELVHRAVHCDEMRFVLLDARETKLELPETQGLSFIWSKLDHSTGMIREGWVAFRSLRYNEKKQRWELPPPATPIPPTPRLEVKETDASSKFERVTDRSWEP